MIGAAIGEDIGGVDVTYEAEGTWTDQFSDTESWTTQTSTAETWTPQSSTAEIWTRVDPT